LSVELALVILVMVAAERRFGPPSRAVLRVLGFAWIFLALGHYGYMTAPALFGRDINLYWDLRFVPAVAGLLVMAGPFRVVLPVGAAIVAIVIALYAVVRWALGRVADGVCDSRARRVLTIVAGAAALLFVVQRVMTDRLPLNPEF